MIWDTAVLIVTVPLTVTVAKAAVPLDVTPVNAVSVPVIVELPVTAIPPALIVQAAAAVHPPVKV